MKAKMRKMQREKEKSMNSLSKRSNSELSIIQNNNQLNNQNSKKNNKEKNLQLHLSSNSNHSSAQSISQLSNNTNINQINKIYTKKILKTSLMTGNSAAKPAEDDYEMTNSNIKSLTPHIKEPIYHHHHNNKKSSSNNDMRNIKFPFKKHNLENEKRKHHSKKNLGTKKKSKSNITNKNNSINNSQHNDNSRMIYFLEQKQNLNPLEKKEELSKMLKLLNTDISVDNFELGQNMNYIESKKELEKLQQEVKEEEKKLNILMTKNKTDIHDYIEKIMNLQNQLMNSPQWEVITLEEENKIDEVKIKNLKEKIEIIKEENEKEIEEMKKINFDDININIRKEIEKVRSLKEILLKFKGREIPDDITKEIEVIMKYKNGL